MKNIFSAFGGAISITEENEKVSISWDESIGGGQAAGVVKGQGSIVLDAALGIKLGEALLNSHLPPAVLPLAQVIEGVANQAIAALA